MAGKEVTKDGLIAGKSADQRKSEVLEMLRDIDSVAAPAGDIPAEVVTLAQQLRGIAVRELLPANMTVDRLEDIVTKKGTHLYEVYSTGFGLQDIKQAGKYKIRAKVQLFIA